VVAVFAQLSKGFAKCVEGLGCFGRRGQNLVLRRRRRICLSGSSDRFWVVVTGDNSVDLSVGLVYNPLNTLVLGEAH
jgi:hypothetical protein